MTGEHVQTQVVEQAQKINKFTNKIDALAFQQLNGGTVIKEQGQSIFYVMRPEVNDVRQIVLPMEETK